MHFSDAFRDREHVGDSSTRHSRSFEFRRILNRLRWIALGVSVNDSNLKRAARSAFRFLSKFDHNNVPVPFDTIPNKISSVWELTSLLSTREQRKTKILIGPRISSRCFFKDGSSSIPCAEFRMVTHVQGSTVFNLKFQCMTVHFSVNKVIFISSETVYFCAK